MRGLIAEEVHTTFLDALTPLWGEAWHLGYQSGKALVTGEDAIFTAKVSSDALDSFIATEGTHWLDQIARTGLHGANARAEVIARSEVARAMNAGAIAAYRDNGVTHKHLLVAPNDTCDVCKAARKQGVIPLDSIFPAGGLGGPFHPQCRCVPAPANVNVEPPQAHLGKAEDHSLVAFILFRSMDAGREVFLLQKRGSDMNNPGTWCLPGGTSHTGESPWECAYRESCEEMGDLPACNPTVHFMQVENKRTIHIFMCDVPEIFTPHMDGDTQFETAGYGWFSRKEIKKLPLQPNFAEQWKNIKWDEVAKFIANTESGEMLVGVDEDQPLFPAGARWPYPRRSDGAEDPHYGTAATDAFPSRDPSRNTPAAHGPVDGADVVGGNTRVYAPDGDETAEQPKKRGRSAKKPKKFPSQEPPMPQNTQGGTESGGQSVGSETGVPPSAERKMFQQHVMEMYDNRGRYPLKIAQGEQYQGDSFTKMYLDMVTGKATPRPATGSVPAEAPKPMQPHSEAAVPPVDPSENVATEDDEGEIAYYPHPEKKRYSAEDASVG